MHKQNTIYHSSLVAKLLMLLCMLAGHAAPASAQAGKTIIIACDWDFAPYEFINSEGKSAGFNIDVLHRILKQLDIPHEFMMNARKQGIKAFMDREADLIVDYKNRFMQEEDSSYVRSRSILHYYKPIVASKNGSPVATRPEDLFHNSHTVLNASNDSIMETALHSIIDSINPQFATPREALAGLENGKYDYFLWGEEPMEWKVKEYNLHSISLHDFDLPAREIHIVGYDKKLIDDIDNQFARLQQSGEIDHLRNRWFHPDAVAPHTSMLPFYIALAIILVSLFIFAVYRLIKLRVKNAVRNNRDLEAMMHQALNMGSYYVMVYDYKHNHVYNQHGDALPDEGLTFEEMTAYIHPDDRQATIERDRNRNLEDHQATPFTIRWNNNTLEQPNWIVISGYSFTEYDEYGHPINVIFTTRDITEEIKEEHQIQERGQRYQKMFDSTLLAMSFYDKDGMLIDLNENMKKLCGITEESVDFFRQQNLFDIDILQGDFDPGSNEAFHICQHMYYPEINIDKYIEFRVRPAFDENDELLYYIISARDVTAERAMYLELSRQTKALHQMEATNTLYEQEMKTLMENCNMFVWRSDLKTGIISFSHTLNKVEFTRTMEEHVQSMYEEDRLAAAKMAQELSAVRQPFNMVHHFYYTPTSDKPCWLAISGMPLTDEKGNVTQLFGIVRDVTELMEAQERLKEETARAENSGMLKSTFLANMTHEIRTPLNAIMGFSDLLHMVGSTEERKEFVHIIRNNCDMLMRLINDIFEASTMDVKPLEIKPEEVDFAEFFNVIALSLSQRVQEPGVEFIVENPYQHFTTILDKGRMQQVITNFVTNAVKYTHQGHIRIGYRYQAEEESEQRKGIYMYCEDTGTGIPKEKQKKVFDRFVKLNDFVQGTGLGLNICKAIAERANGHIGVDSEGDGCGSTFWIWVPCPVLSDPIEGG